MEGDKKKEKGEKREENKICKKIKKLVWGRGGLNHQPSGWNAPFIHSTTFFQASLYGNIFFCF